MDFGKLKKRPDLKKISIQSLVAWGFVVLIILPFIALSVIFILVYEDYAKKSFSQYMVEALEGVQRQAQESYESFVDGTMNFYHNGIVNILEKPELTQSDKILLQEKMEELLHSYNNRVVSVIIQKGDESFYTGEGFPDMEGLVLAHEAKIAEKKGRHLWLGPFFMIPKSKSGVKMILAKSLNARDEKNIAQAFLIVDIEEFSKIFKDESLKKVAQYLYDAEGNLLYFANVESGKNQLRAEQLTTEGTSGYHIVKLNGVRSLAVNVRSARTGWIVAASMPMSLVLEDFKPIKVMLVALALIYVFFLLGMIYLLDRYIILPVRALTDSMDHFAGGDLNAMIQVPAIGEVEKLNRHFNRMTIRIAELIKRNEQEVREKNEFKMETLRAQLNPHFIYNSLNTIKWMAAINRQENIQSLTEALIQLLMYSTKGKEDDYTLKDEMKLIQCYSVIQKARFMNFDICYEVQEEALSNKMIKFLLQPIVENAIIHGFGRGKGRRGIITISVSCDQYLNIVVEDNGQGFDVERLKKSEERTDKEHTNIAIKNIRQMIELEYGEGYGLLIESELGRGTRVTYKLPILPVDSIGDSKELPFHVQEVQTEEEIQ